MKEKKKLSEKETKKERKIKIDRERLIEKEKVGMEWMDGGRETRIEIMKLPIIIFIFIFIPIASPFIPVNCSTIVQKKVE